MLLAELYIVSALRGRGLGRQLLTAAMRHARGRGVTPLDHSYVPSTVGELVVAESELRREDGE